MGLGDCDREVLTNLSNLMGNPFTVLKDITDFNSILSHGELISTERKFIEIVYELGNSQSKFTVPVHFTNSPQCPEVEIPLTSKGETHVTIEGNQYIVTLSEGHELEKTGDNKRENRDSRTVGVLTTTNLGSITKTPSSTTTTTTATASDTNNNNSADYRAATSSQQYQ